MMLGAYHPNLLTCQCLAASGDLVWMEAKCSMTRTAAVATGSGISLCNQLLL